MSYRVRFAPRAADDLQRLFDFLADEDMLAAERARAAIAQAIELLRSFPFACHSGFVALYEIEDADTVTVLAVRHQREEDFF